MKAVIVPLACLVIGAIGGFFFSQGGAGTKRSQSNDAGLGQHSSPLGSSLGSSNSSSGGNSSSEPERTGGNNGRAGTGRHVSLTQLLEISTGGYTSSSVIELWRATENLSTDHLLELARGIEELQPNDQRAWQLRNTIISKLAQANPDAALTYAKSIENRNHRQQALSAVLMEISQEDLGKSLKLLREIEDPTMFRRIAESMASSGTEGAGEAMFQLLQERSGTDIQWGYNNLFRNWARDDFGAAAANLSKLDGTQRRNYALQGLGGAVDLENLEEGLEFAKSLGAANERTQFLGSILRTLASTDPQKALAVLEAHGSGSQRKGLLSSLASSWLTADPESAQEWIESLDNPRDRVAALQNSMWNESGNTEWIAEQLSNLPANSHTQNLASNLAQRWGQRDPKAAAEWVRSLPAGRARTQARQSLMNSWAQADPVAAAEFFSEEPSAGSSASNDPFSNSRSGTAGLIAGQWVKQDPEAAISWMDSLDVSDSMRSSMLSNMVTQWSQADPKAAASYVLELDAKQRDASINSLVGNWARNDFDGAESWVNSIEDTNARNRALGALIAISAGEDPQKAATALADASAGMEEEEIRKNLSGTANNIAHSWAQTDPTAAADWAVGLPEGSNRSQVLQTVVNQWAQYEPSAASEWLTTFEPGSDRDGAVTGLVSTILRDDPEAAFAWGASIDDESKRSSSVRQTMNHWRKVDSDAARAAIESSDLSETLREQLLEEFPKEGTQPTSGPTTIHTRFYEADPFGY